MNQRPRSRTNAPSAPPREPPAATRGGGGYPCSAKGVSALRTPLANPPAITNLEHHMHHTTLDDLPADHIAHRTIGWSRCGQNKKPIGRLTPDEFDVCDAIDTLLRAGLQPTIRQLMRSLDLGYASAKKRLARAKNRGIVVKISAGEWTAPSGRPYAVSAYQLTPLARELFRESLAVMDSAVSA